MGRSRYFIFETEYPYFMTCTVVGWLPVFTRKKAVEEIYDYAKPHRAFHTLLFRSEHPFSWGAAQTLDTLSQLR